MWADTLRLVDHIPLGIDGYQDNEKVRNSYYDEGGHAEDFVRNAIIHSNRILGPLYCHGDWTVSGKL